MWDSGEYLEISKTVISSSTSNIRGEDSVTVPSGSSVLENDSQAEGPSSGTI